MKNEKFALFLKDVSASAYDSNITWSKNNIYYIIKETENSYCIDQSLYPNTQCWIDKECEGDLFMVKTYQTNAI